MKELFKAVEHAKDFVLASKTVRVPVTKAGKKVLMKEVTELRKALEVLETKLDIVVPICGGRRLG